MQDIESKCFKKASKDDLVLAVSHAWPYGAHPDPMSNKAGPLAELIDRAKSIHKLPGRTLVFCDFLSVSQRPFRPGQSERTPQMQADFAKALRAFPLIYLQADAVLHIDVPAERVPGDGVDYKAFLFDLDCVTLIDLNGSIHVVHVDKESVTEVAPFDRVNSIGGMPVHSLDDVKEAKRRLAEEDTQRNESWFWGCSSSCACGATDISPVSMTKCPFGTWSALSADQKGWVYLERFASMVKGAMAHADQAGNVVFATSEALNQELKEGMDILRAAAAGGQQQLEDALKYFTIELDKKQFTAVSVDKAKNTGGMGGGEDDAPANPFHAPPAKVQLPMKDKDVVASLMSELVTHLSTNWQAVQDAQRQRQLLVAVTAGDVAATRQLLAVGVNPNVQDAQGLTCLHAAAKARGLEVVQALVQMKGDLNISDCQFNFPVHRLGLFSNGPTIELFRELAPTQALLEAPNAASVTPIQRFAAWAITAVDSKPFKPATDLVAELKKLFPTMKTAGLNTEARFSDLKKGRVSESTLELTINGTKRSVLVFEPPGGAKIEAHIVYTGLTIYMPFSLQKPAVENIAKYLCTRFSAKMFVLYEDSFDMSQLNTPADWGPAMASIIEALPFEGQFVFVDSTIGTGPALLWMLQSRISACVIVNALGWFNDEFFGSPAFNGLMNIINGLKDTYEKRDIEGCVKSVGNFLFAQTTDDINRGQKVYAGALKTASDNWWSLANKIPSHMQDYTPFCKALPKLGAVPVVLLCGSLSPALMVQETAARLLGTMPNSGVSYIRDSKQWFEIEGETPTMGVAYILTEVMKHKGQPFQVAELVAKTQLQRKTPAGAKK